MKILKRTVRIITLSGYNSQTEPLVKQLYLLKMEDQLKLQELQFYVKYTHINLLVYLVNSQIIPNVNIHLHDTHKSKNVHTARIKHEFSKIYLKYNLICHSL